MMVLILRQTKNYTGYLLQERGSCFFFFDRQGDPALLGVGVASSPRPLSRGYYCSLLDETPKLWSIVGQELVLKQLVVSKEKLLLIIQVSHLSVVNLELGVF